MAEMDENGADDSRRRPAKSDSAFRTIREVAEELDVPQHVLRFWETKFAQVRPLKRGGGRRYYRPEDIVLLKRIRSLLYTDGLTIKGVQKLLREAGVKAVTSEDVPTSPVEQAVAASAKGLSPEEATKIVAELTALRDDLRSLAQGA